MKYIDALRKVDKSPENTTDIPMRALCQHLDVEFNHEYTEQDRAKSYWLRKWYCTDEWVGTQVIYLDHELIGVADRIGRRMDYEFEFISLEAAHKLRELLIEINVSEHPDAVDILDENEEIGEFYHNSYSSQLLVDKGFYKGQPVTVVEKYGIMSNIDIWTSVKVKFEDGTEQLIPMSEFDIPWHTNV